MLENILRKMFTYNFETTCTCMNFFLDEWAYHENRFISRIFITLWIIFFFNYHYGSVTKKNPNMSPVHCHKAYNMMDWWIYIRTRFWWGKKLNQIKLSDLKCFLSTFHSILRILKKMLIIIGNACHRSV